jgi:uncharacterized membrane protein
METVPAGVPGVKIGDWLRDGWEVFFADVGMFLLASLVYNLIISTCLGGLILFGPLTCGMYLMIFDRMKGGKVDIRRLFNGFDFFGQSFLAGLAFFLAFIIAWVIAYVGFTACVIPSIIGISLMVLVETIFLFTFQLIVQRGAHSADAIRESLNKIKENFWQFLLFGLVLWLINLVGYTTVVGWLVTTPLTFGASAAAYRDIFGLEGTEVERQTSVA